MRDACPAPMATFHAAAAVAGDIDLVSLSFYCFVNIYEYVKRSYYLDFLVRTASRNSLSPNNCVNVLRQQSTRTEILLRQISHFQRISLLAVIL